MATPFTRQPLVRPSFLRRVFRRPLRENAVVEIRNRLADADDVMELTVEEVETIADRHRARLCKHLRSERIGLVREYLEHCLADRHRGDAEIARTAHLKRLLHLSDDDLAEVETEAVGGVYGAAVDEILSDQRVDPAEREFIRRLERELRLPPVVARRIYGSRSQEILQRHLGRLAARQKLSPEDDEELRALADNLGVEIRMDARTRDALDWLRLAWHIQEGELPEITPDVRLYKQERCHLIVHARWYEHRTVTRRVRYAGPTLRIKIAKGLYWRMGDLGVQRISEDILKLIDSGKLYVTDRRILFRGERGNKTIRLNRIVDFEPSSNGITIEKDAGKTPFLEFQPGADICAMILGRLLGEMD